MNSRTIVSVVAVTFVLAGMQILACLAGTAAGVVGGILLPILGRYLLRFFDVALENALTYIAIPVCGSLTGVLVLAVGTAMHRFTPLWLAIAGAGVSAFICNVVARRRSRRCGLCNRHIAGEMAFACPRCNLLVCERNCWVFEHLRCKLCEQNQVPLPRLGQQWWNLNFGPVSRQGRCEYCKRPAESADSSVARSTLRPCRQCGRFQCEECWDYLNGQCSRCRWTVPDLPTELQTLMAPQVRASFKGNSDRNHYA